MDDGASSEGAAARPSATGDAAGRDEAGRGAPGLGGAGLDAPRDLGRVNSIDVLAERVSLAGRTVVDIGCGGMAFSKLLAARGALVHAVEPDPRRAAANRAIVAELGPDPRIEFSEADGRALPLADGSQEGACFSFSLHHVPAADHARVLEEARRVLKPGGFLCVVEPAGGPLNDVMQLFHDEDRERSAAQASLRAHAVPAFASCEDLAYHSVIEYASFAAFVEAFGGGPDQTAYTAEDVRHPAVREAFERCGEPYGDDGTGRRFPSNKRMMLLRDRI